MHFIVLQSATTFRLKVVEIFIPKKQNKSSTSAEMAKPTMVKSKHEFKTVNILKVAYKPINYSDYLDHLNCILVLQRPLFNVYTLHIQCIHRLTVLL